LPPYIVGLTGGIGSGKSTVCAMLREKGALIVDADAVVHELQVPGTVVFDEMVEAFGREILSPDGTLDRPKLGSIVFGDDEKRQKLQSIVWPRVGERVAELIASAGDDDIVILDVPLMAESTEGSRRLAQKIIVIDVSPETQVEHLAARGVAADVARARMAAQASREERLNIADHVLHNDGSLDELQKQVDALWDEILASR
jgi:dephospho-CoA kinase